MITLTDEEQVFLKRLLGKLANAETGRETKPAPRKPRKTMEEKVEELRQRIISGKLKRKTT